jgi:hypothetical protein
MSEEELPPGSKTPHPAQSTGARPADWPEGIRPISVEGLSHIGVGNDGSLYWDGKPIQVARRFDLSVWQKIGAVLTVTAALAAAGGTVASAMADWRTPHCSESSAT